MVSLNEVVVTLVSRGEIKIDTLMPVFSALGECLSHKTIENSQFTPLNAVDIIVRLKTPTNARTIASSLAPQLESLQLDYAVQPSPKPAKQLFVADMDSTMISIECIDELAGVAGIKNQVAEITERAMQGELNFESALIERVALLKGLPLSAVDTVFEDVLRYNEGSETLINTLNNNNIFTILVSGGFTLFTKRVAKHLGFQDNKANTLGFNGEVFTGTVGMPILGKEAKLEALQHHCQRLKCTPKNTIAIGDGANDGLMVAAAGLGIAYHAKPVLKSHANANIQFTDLTAVLAFIQ